VPGSLALEWLTEALPDDRYKLILDFEMPSAALEYHPVFTIRGRSPRPDNRKKNEPWEWEKLPPVEL
jgi:hypothetical protein